MKTQKEIMKTAHKIAKNIDILGDYKIKLSIGLKMALDSTLYGMIYGIIFVQIIY